MTAPARHGAALVVTHDDRGRPDFTIETRTPTRYDVPTHGSGPVPAEPEPGAMAVSLRVSSDTHGGARLALVHPVPALGGSRQVVAVIDREDFGAWAEQVAHLAARIRSGL